MTKKEMQLKVVELFAYRHIPELMQMSGLKKQATYLKNLKTLQIKIYLLDQYLETTWDIKKSGLNQHWKEIYQSLEPFGVKRKDAPSLCNQIMKYQSHELKMRDGKWPTDYNFRHLYYYKSCDVKLMRRLIYQDAPDLNKKIKESDWRFYDYITEINDDIDDVFEDTKSINGNRFLISIIQLGAEKTGAEFRSELQALIKETNDHFSDRKLSLETQMLYTWTLTRANETLDLMEKKLKLKKLATVSKSLIAQHM